MNVLVVLRAVRDPASFVVNRRAQKVFVNQERYRLNPADLHALEAALRLGAVGHRVTAVAYGGEAAEDGLRQARAMGAQRGLLVREGTLQSADASTLTRVLRHAIDFIGSVDLVLQGSEVLDADLAQTGPRLAAALGWPFIEAAWQVEAGAESERSVAAVVRRKGGFVRLAARLPAVISVAPDSHRPRYAQAPRIISVFSSPEAIEVVTLEDLGVGVGDLAPRTEYRGEAFPPERVLGQRLDGAPSDVARAVAQVLCRS